LVFHFPFFLPLFDVPSSKPSEKQCGRSWTCAFGSGGGFCCCCACGGGGGEAGF
jgi:hypothetical protein